ncbi:hypothetical protein PIB30_062690 [Stylosanthes scabra]|uniref:Uncharacterized protein n=1 Tax=Stylosanthes scabra TaxID=79078 RepID=A0ABU6YJV2_9FABA|nr:hypothetical protein [Stylosanthes scabra]
MVAKEGDPAVEEDQDEEKNEGDADRGAAEAVDGVWLGSCGEHGDDEGGAVGGEEVDGDEEENGEKEETQWGYKL